MFGSLRSRLLLLSAVVGLVAVAATALIAQQVASDDLRRALDRDLDTEDEIIEKLEWYVLVNRSWTGVDDLVAELTDATGERIAVRDVFDRTIADSDPGAELPEQPAGVIDIRGEVIDELMAEEIPTFVADQTILDCEISAQQQLEEEFFDGADDFDDNVELEEFEYLIDDYLFAEFLACIDPTLDGAVPEVGLVYIGDGNPSAASILGEGGPDYRVAAVAVAVLLGAIGATALALRPVLAPIETLRAGAKRLGDGDLDTRVSVDGAVELVELGQSFNSMADSLQADGERRQRWTSDVAHELRNPVQNLRGQLEAAQDGLMEPDDAWFNSLIDEVNQLGLLVDDLQVLTLTDSGRIALDREHLDLRVLADEVVASHRPRAEQLGIELTAMGSAQAYADARRLRQVLGNLLDNALRHTPSGGAVAIRVANRPGDAAHGATAEAAVIDNGEGIAPDVQERIFDRFARADSHRGRSAGGSGLGLSIVEALVEAHGGTVSVASEVGAGSTFVVRLPLEPQAELTPTDR